MRKRVCPSTFGTRNCDGTRRLPRSAPGSGAPGSQLRHQSRRWTPPQPETSASSAYKRGDVAEKTELCGHQRFDKLRPLLQMLLSLLVCSNVCRQSSNILYKNDICLLSFIMIFMIKILMLINILIYINQPLAHPNALSRALDGPGVARPRTQPQKCHAHVL